MPSNVFDPFFYPGTETHRNRHGLRDKDALAEAEYEAYVAGAWTMPPTGFTPDMRGLKRVHRHLFGDVYEWAGYARHEPVIVDGQIVELPVHQVSKGDIVFGSSEESRLKLPRDLVRHRDALFELRDSGALTLAKWCEHTAEAVVAINHAHPFIEGNGRAMRHFVGCSAEYFGFVCKVPRGPQWMAACEEARRRRSAEPMVGLLAQQALLGLGERERERLRTAAPTTLSDDELRLLTVVPGPPALREAVSADPDVLRSEKRDAKLEIQYRARAAEVDASEEAKHEWRSGHPWRAWLADRGVLGGALCELDKRIRAGQAAKGQAWEALGTAREETRALRLATARRLRKEREPELARARALREEWERRHGRGRDPDCGMER